MLKLPILNSCPPNLLNMINKTCCYSELLFVHIKKHVREQEMKEHFFEMKSKPQAVEGPYATEEIDEKGVATLKEENADWWDGGLK